MKPPVVCPKCSHNLIHTRSLSGDSGLVSGSSCVNCGNWIDDEREVVMPEVPPAGESERKQRGRPPKVHQTTAVITSDTHVVSLIDVFRAKQARDMDEFIAGLDDIVNPLEKLEYALRWVK